MLSLKFIFYALLAYLLVRAVANLLRAILQQQDVSEGRARPGSASPGSASPGSASPGSASPGSASPGSASRRGAPGGDNREKDERATRLRDEDDIEEARWEDL